MKRGSDCAGSAIFGILAIEDFFVDILSRGGNKMLTYCHVSVGLDVANIAINLVRRFDFNLTLMGFLP